MSTSMYKLIHLKNLKLFWSTLYTSTNIGLSEMVKFLASHKLVFEIEFLYLFIFSHSIDLKLYRLYSIKCVYVGFAMYHGGF